ncbi:hypothetical protein DJ031_09265 [bacterium endosymbiont of Escarpia laminata]|nr:MAG: hypothetical protein DJ031_09265 [bacterium endosymbiont of Escarpia laminata]
MLRRIYLLFPQRYHVEQALPDLQRLGVDRRHMHAVAREGIDISGLPEASVRQRTDFGARLERALWNLNLLTFFLALILLIGSLFVGLLGWALLNGLVMSATYLAGSYFVRHVPHAHMDECRSALKHGEILLMVDVPRWRVSEIGREIRRLHPEAEIGAVGWTVEALQI